MADRYWVGGTGTWDSSSTARWSAASAIQFSASCGGTIILDRSNGSVQTRDGTDVYSRDPVTSLTTVGSPALAVGMTVWSSTNVSLGTIVSGSGNAWVVSTGGVYTLQTMSAATTGASVPTNTDNVIFNTTASVPSAYTVTLSGSLNCLSLTVSDLTPTFNGTGSLSLAGSFNIVAATVWSNTGTLTFAGTSSNTITTNGVAIQSNVALNGAGGTLQLQDSLTLGSSATFTHAAGTLDINGKTLSAGASYTTATGTKNLTFNGGTLLCLAASSTAFNNAVPTGFTTTAGTGTGTISMTAATAKTFVGGGSTFNCTLSQGGAGALTIAGSNTFSDIVNTVQPTTVTFTAGTTNTFASFSLSGTAGNLVTIDSTSAGSQATISKNGTTVSRNYLSIRDNAATGGALWYAGPNSTNAGNVSGWIFTAPDYSITASQGAYSVSGQTATLLRSKKIDAVYGSYSVTGQTASISRGCQITASNGAYTINGQTAAITRTRLLLPLTGVYAVNGQTAAITRSRLLLSSTGSYSVAGQPATLSFGRLLSAQNGVYSIAGQAVDISIGIPPTPITAVEYFVEIRSFTERRRF